MQPFTRLQIANAVGAMNNGATAVLIPWIALETTQSPAQAGYIAALSSLPVVFLMPFVGAIIARLGKRRVSWISDVLSGIAVLLVPAVSVTSGLNVWSLGALALLGAVFDPAGYTARKSMLPDIASASQMSLARANGRFEAVFGVGWIAGPALGSMLIAAAGWEVAMLIVGLTFSIPAISVASLPGGAITAADPEDGGILQSTREGYQALLQDRPLTTMTLTVMLLAGIYLPLETVLLPVHFNRLDQPQSLGWTLSAMSLGGVLGALAFGRLIARISPRALFLAAVTGTTLALAPMGLLPPTWGFVALGLMIGLAWGPMNPLMNQLVQVRIAPDRQPHVFGIQLSLLYIGPPVGAALMGVLVENVGVSVSIATIAGLITLVLIALSTSRHIRRLDLNTEGA